MAMKNVVPGELRMFIPPLSSEQCVTQRARLWPAWNGTVVWSSQLLSVFLNPPPKKAHTRYDFSFVFDLEDQ